MNTQNFDYFTDLSNPALDAAKQLAELNLRTMERVYSQQSKLVADFYSAAQDNLKQLSAAKDFDSLLTTQAEIARNSSAQWADNARETTAFMSEVQGEYNQLVKANAEVVVKTPAKATKARAKAA